MVKMKEGKRRSVFAIEEKAQWGHWNLVESRIIRRAMSYRVLEVEVGQVSD